MLMSSWIFMTGKHIVISEHLYNLFWLNEKLLPKHWVICAIHKSCSFYASCCLFPLWQIFFRRSTSYHQPFLLYSLTILHMPLLKSLNCYKPYYANIYNHFLIFNLRNITDIGALNCYIHLRYLVWKLIRFRRTINPYLHVMLRTWNSLVPFVTRHHS